MELRSSLTLVDTNGMNPLAWQQAQLCYLSSTKHKLQRHLRRISFLLHSHI